MQTGTTTVIIKNAPTNAFGIASFILGVVSIFFAAPLFVPLSVLFAIIALLCRQVIWGVMGLVCSLIGFVTSPVLMGLFGIATIAALYSPSNSQVHQQPQQLVAQHYSLSAKQLSAERLKQANREAADAVMECRNKRLSGELKTFVESANCSNARFVAAYQNAGYPYMDLINLIVAKRLETSERVDKQELTEAQAKLEMAEFVSHVVDTERKRNLQIRN